MASKTFLTFAPLVNILPENIRIKLLYVIKQKKIPNLKDPITFNEKVNWRKLFDRDPLFSKLADKIAVKDYVKSKNSKVFVPKILWQGKSLCDLPSYCELPEKFVIKANHASGTNYIVKDGNYPSKSELIKLEKNWRKTRIDKTFVEWGYTNIPITFFVEEYLDFSDFVPVDYKFWIFSGRVEFVQIDTQRFINHQRGFFDRNGNRLPFLLTYPDIEAPVCMPNNYADMITIAEDLSSKLDFIRVDLYTNESEVFFGEITVYPDAGYGKFSPSSFDEKVGELWDLGNKV